MNEKEVKSLILLIFVHGFISVENIPFRRKLNIRAMSPDLMNKIWEAWCSNRKLVREGRCNIDGFSTQFCLGLDMIRYFKLSYGTLILNEYEPDKLGDMLLSMQCSDNGFNITDISITHSSIPFTTHKIWKNIQQIKQPTGVTNSISTKQTGAYDSKRLTKVEFIDEQDLDNSSLEIIYDNSYEIWIIPSISIILVYIVIIAYLVHHRVKRLDYLCCMETEQEIVDNSREHSEKKE